MSQTPYPKSSTINFQGMSGARYSFQAWPMDTKFKATGGIYLVTRRECLDRTFPTKASHRCLAIGQTADLVTAAGRRRVSRRGQDHGHGRPGQRRQPDAVEPERGRLDQPPADQLALGRKLIKEYDIRPLTSCSTCHR